MTRMARPLTRNGVLTARRVIDMLLTASWPPRGRHRTPLDRLDTDAACLKSEREGKTIFVLWSSTKLMSAMRLWSRATTYTATSFLINTLLVNTCGPSSTPFTLRVEEEAFTRYGAKRSRADLTPAPRGSHMVSIT